MNNLPYLPAVLAWINAHREAIIQDLQSVCGQPSIAATGQGMMEMANLVAERLDGFADTTHVLSTGGFPLVLAHCRGTNAPTLGMYNHYDVQPVEPIDEWMGDPFVPAIRDGCLYARGAADNKGSLVARIWAAKAWLVVTGTLPCNLLFCVEGEEEIGSPNLASSAALYQPLLHADAWLWEAGYRNEEGTLDLYAGVKGIVCLELQVRTIKYDLHSAYAGIAPNAASRLIDALQCIRRADGFVLIPEFYSDILPPTPDDHRSMALFPLNPAELKARWDIKEFVSQTEVPIQLTEQYLWMPTCNIAGFSAGYQGVGIKTVLPATASVKIDFRLVPNQDPCKIQKLLAAYLHERGFSDIIISDMNSSERPAQNAISTPLMRAVERATQQVYGGSARVWPRAAGTGPMYQLCQQYGVPAVGGVGIGYSGSQIHAPNEHIRIDDLILGTNHVATIFAEFGFAAENMP